MHDELQLRKGISNKTCKKAKTEKESVKVKELAKKSSKAAYFLKKYIFEFKNLFMPI